MKLPSPSASAMVSESERVDPSVSVPEIMRLPVGSLFTLEIVPVAALVTVSSEPYPSV